MNVPSLLVAIGVHAVVWAVLAFTLVAVPGNVLVELVAWVGGTGLVVYSVWQSCRRIRAGEPLRDAVCWLWD